MPTQTASSTRYPVEPGQRIFPPGAIPTDLLFQNNQEILISHHGEHYRLCITRNGKRRRQPGAGQRLSFEWRAVSCTPHDARLA